PAEKAIAETSTSTLTFSLEIPSETFVYFYVVALKLKDGKEPASSDSYENKDGVDGNMFVLGDGRNTDDPTSRKRRSTTSDYFNGPLEPGTNYSVFQRIIINEMGDYYSTDWSPPSKTSEGQVPDIALSHLLGKTHPYESYRNQCLGNFDQMRTLRYLAMYKLPLSRSDPFEIESVSQ
ncbi:Hypothetical predicted protein, partial [Paramuricea clavata]